ncbi:MAG: STM4015 family protein [Peptococcaceae bacterium]|nr:STM4015 family protein [Peptococcaceae bacterium]
MKRCFIYQDGNSQKFWNIDIEDTGFTVTYGKLGTAGQSSTKSFDSTEKCQREADKLIAEKTKKGYAESSEDDVKSAKNEGKKYYFEEDYEHQPKELAAKILADKRLPELKYITIGAWGESYEKDPGDVLDMMIANKERFQHIESLFIGDMNFEECEISWIIQYSRYGDLLRALPNLRILKIKGANSLSFGPTQLDHDSLEELQIICGGLPHNVVEELALSNLPNLKKLILYLGIESYGYDCTLEQLAALASSKKFPNLKELGFTNSKEQNEIVELLLASDILPQLEVLDISCGCLTDKGGQMILDAQDKLSGLKKLKADYHYMSKDMMKKLKALPFDVSVTDQQEADEDYADEEDMYPLYTE